MPTKALKYPIWKLVDANSLYMHYFWQHVANQRARTGARLENHRLGEWVHLGKPETHKTLSVSLGPK